MYKRQAKYGALSVPKGTVRIVTTLKGQQVEISWTEAGGPQVMEPQRTGFGTRLTDTSVVNQLGGTIQREWLPGGLRVQIGVQADRLCRD